MKRFVFYKNIFAIFIFLLGFHSSAFALEENDTQSFITRNVLRPENLYILIGSDELAAAIETKSFKSLFQQQQKRAKAYCQWHGFSHVYTYSIRLEYNTDFQFGRAYRIRKNETVPPEIYPFEIYPLTAASPLKKAHSSSLITEVEVKSLKFEREFLSAYSRDFGTVYPHFVLSQLMCSFEPYEDVDLNAP